MRLCSWDEANAMVDGWGLSGPMEPYCMACTLVEVEQYAQEFGDDLSDDEFIEDFLSSAHRGGFVPAVVSGVVCVGCGKEVTSL